MSTDTGRVVRTKRKHAVSNVNYKRSKCNNDIQYENMILQMLKKHEQTATSGNNHVWMTLEIALDSIPMHLMLKKNNAQTQTSLKHVPVLTRAKEEEYMRECYKPEDQCCMMQESCECNFVDLQAPFTGVAFVGAELNMLHTGLCILCLRKTTQMLFYRVVAGGLRSDSLMQVYGNLSGVAGEYHEWGKMLTLKGFFLVESQICPAGVEKMRFQ